MAPSVSHVLLGSLWWRLAQDWGGGHMGRGDPLPYGALSRVPLSCHCAWGLSLLLAQCRAHLLSVGTATSTSRTAVTPESCRPGEAEKD